MKNILKTIHKKSERGQAIILIAFTIVGLVAIVGLMTDGGITLIEYARLKRGIDSASIAAAAQFRKNFVADDIKNAGEEFLQFNQSTADVTIYICDPLDPITNTHPLGAVATIGDPPPPTDGAWHDPALCPAIGAPARKLVRVEASRVVTFGFMRVLGINETTIKATSVGEAASIDMVLVIDTSTSMAYETNDFDTDDPPDGAIDIGVLNPAYSGTPSIGNPTAGNPGDDPEICNAHMNDPRPDVDQLKRCEPLGKVIDAAIAFVDEMFFPYDRIALVATTGQAVPGSNIRSRIPVTVLDFSDDINVVKAALRNLKVYQPVRCPYPYVPLDPGNPRTPCLVFNGDDGFTYYRQQICIPRNEGNSPVTCGPSNVGGGLYRAGDAFALARTDSFWVAVALFGGPVNASDPPDAAIPDGFCPGSFDNITWKLPGGSGYCRDEDSMPASYSPPTAVWSPQAEAYIATYMQNYNWVTNANLWPDPTRHHYTVDNTIPSSPIINYPANYDADDYARDGADYIAAPSPNGQGATLFSICMGSYCRTYPNINDPASAEMLGRYMALEAGDQHDLLGNITTAANHGLYFYAENSNVVALAFANIAENIFTRISQ